MPSLTGQPEYQAHSPDSYRLLAGLISRRATASLGPTWPPPDTLMVSFNVGPYGGIFQALIEHEQLEASHSPEAERAVLQAVRSLPRLQPGRRQGEPVSVRIFIQVPVPTP